MFIVAVIADPWHLAPWNGDAYRRTTVADELKLRG